MGRTIFVMIGFIVLMSGCGVPESDYEKVVSERKALEQSLSKLQQENGSLNEGLLVLRAENEALRDQIGQLSVEIKHWQEEAQSKPSPTKEEPETKPRFYEVKKGDTLWSIARKTGVPLDTLRDLNNIQRSRIDAGQKLRLTP